MGDFCQGPVVCGNDNCKHCYPNTKNCNNCKATVRDNFTYCPVCGTKIFNGKIGNYGDH